MACRLEHDDAARLAMDDIRRQWLELNNLLPLAWSRGGVPGVGALRVGNRRPRAWERKRRSESRQVLVGVTRGWVEGSDASQDPLFAVDRDGLTHRNVGDIGRGTVE